MTHATRHVARQIVASALAGYAEGTHPSAAARVLMPLAETVVDALAAAGIVGVHGVATPLPTEESARLLDARSRVLGILNSVFSAAPPGERTLAATAIVDMLWSSGLGFDAPPPPDPDRLNAEQAHATDAELDARARDHAVRAWTIAAIQYMRRPEATLEDRAASMLVCTMTVAALIHEGFTIVEKKWAGP